MHPLTKMIQLSVQHAGSQLCSGHTVVPPGSWGSFWGVSLPSPAPQAGSHSWSLHLRAVQAGDERQSCEAPALHRVSRPSALAQRVPGTT